jgi:N-acetylglutamate synthase-like GNAT family acetyltransferase
MRDPAHPGDSGVTRNVPLYSLPLAAWERQGLKAALAKAGLPDADIDAADLFFWRFETNDMPAGFGGLEVHGDAALLRSVVTLPPVRRNGIGRAIVEKLETEALAHGVRRMFLLTTDCALFFARLGYGPCGRETVPAAILATRQFTELCPATATVMAKEL